jgi:hypothetical protein
MSLQIIRNFTPLSLDEITQRWENHVNFTRQDFLFVKSEDVIQGEMNDHLFSHLVFTYKTPEGVEYLTTRKIFTKDHYFKYWGNLHVQIESFFPFLDEWNHRVYNAESLTVSISMEFFSTEDPFHRHATFEFHKKGESIPLSFKIAPWMYDSALVATAAKKALETQAWKREVLKYHPETVFK